MAFSSGFYNSVGHDRKYDAVQMGMIFDGIIVDGVYQSIGEALIVKVNASPNTVLVGPGRAWFNHSWSYNDSDMIMEKPQAELLLPRIDAIVLDVDASDAVRINSIKWVLGTPSSTPQRPTMIHTLEHHQYPLAFVARRANDETINQADVTNMVGTSSCPFVTGVLQGMNIDNLVLQWRDQWAQFVAEYEYTAIQWTEAQKADFNTFYTEFKSQANEFQQEFESEAEQFQNASEAEFNTWFQGIKDMFDVDPAGALSNKIDAVDEREFKHYSGIINAETTITKGDTVSILTTDDVGTSTTEITKNEGGTKVQTTIVPLTGSFDYISTTIIDRGDPTTSINTSYVKKPKEVQSNA